MTTTRVEERPAAADLPDKSPESGTGHSPPRVVVPILILGTVGEDEPPRAAPSWLARFAVAKRLGGW